MTESATPAAAAEKPRTLKDMAAKYAEWFAVNDDPEEVERELLGAFREAVQVQRDVVAGEHVDRVLVTLDLAAAREALEALNEAAHGDSNDREIDAGREVADILEGVIDTAEEEPSIQELIARALEDRGEGTNDEQALVAAERFRAEDEDAVWTKHLGPLLDELIDEV